MRQYFLPALVILCFAGCSEPDCYHYWSGEIGKAFNDNRFDIEKGKKILTKASKWEGTTKVLNGLEVPISAGVLVLIILDQRLTEGEREAIVAWVKQNPDIVGFDFDETFSSSVQPELELNSIRE